MALADDREQGQNLRDEGLRPTSLLCRMQGHKVVHLNDAGRLTNWPMALVMYSEVVGIVLRKY